MLATASAYAPTAYLAAENSQGGGGMLPMLLMLAAMGGLFYFMLIRPQKRQKQQMTEMQAKLAPGTEVLISGGIYATVRELEDDRAQVEIAPGVTIVIARQSIVKTIDPVVPDSPAGLADDEAGSSTDGSVDTTGHAEPDESKDKDTPRAEWPDEGSKG